MEELNLSIYFGCIQLKNFVAWIIVLKHTKSKSKYYIGQKKIVLLNKENIILAEGKLYRYVVKGNSKHCFQTDCRSYIWPNMSLMYFIISDLFQLIAVFSLCKPRGYMKQKMGSLWSA